MFLSDFESLTRKDINNLQRRFASLKLLHLEPEKNPHRHKVSTALTIPLAIRPGSMPFGAEASPHTLRARDDAPKMNEYSKKLVRSLSTQTCTRRICWYFPAMTSSFTITRRQSPCVSEYPPGSSLSTSSMGLVQARRPKRSFKQGNLIMNGEVGS